MKKIITWRWITHPDPQAAGKTDAKTTTSEATKTDENGETTTKTTTEAAEAEEEDEDADTDVQQRLIPTYDLSGPPGTPRGPPRTRELFVKYDGLSYWSCEWLPELQVEVHQSSLWRCYIKKIGDARIPQLAVDMENEGEEDDEVSRRYYNPKLEPRYYKNGVRPEWLCVHRILNHRKEKGIPMYYLVKWRELGYDQATWEPEKNGEFTDMIENWHQHIDNYWKLR